MPKRTRDLTGVLPPMPLDLAAAANREIWEHRKLERWLKLVDDQLLRAQQTDFQLWEDYCRALREQNIRVTENGFEIVKPYRRR